VLNDLSSRYGPKRCSSRYASIRARAAWTAKEYGFTQDAYEKHHHAVAALFSLKIRLGAKLTQAELYQVSALLEDVAHGGQ